MFQDPRSGTVGKYVDSWKAALRLCCGEPFLGTTITAVRVQSWNLDFLKTPRDQERDGVES